MERSSCVSNGRFPSIGSKRSRSVTAQSGSIRGFTLIEVLFATLLLTVVGAAIASFLGATARGAETRQHASDPALESALALSRFRGVAPDFRSTLLARSNEAVLWLTDLVPSRSAHTSEVGVLRFDETEGILLLETVDPARLDRDRSLEREYLANDIPRLADQLATLRQRGWMVATVLAEGLDAVEIAPEPGNSGAVRLTFMVGDAATTFLLAPSPVEEPIG